MENHIKHLVDEYNASPEMQAVGRVNHPEIGQVARESQILQVPTPLPGKWDVTVKIAASSTRIDEIYAAQGTALGRFYGPKIVSSTNPARIGSCATGMYTK